METEEAEKEMENVEEIAGLFGLKKVGWIFGHPPREEGFIFSGEEILTAAELQLEAADGVEDTTFVTVKVTVDSDGQAEFNAFTLSKQAMEVRIGENIWRFSATNSNTARYARSPNPHRWWRREPSS